MDPRNLTGLEWRVKAQTGFDGLEVQAGVPVQQIGEHDCLVKIEAVSLNFRDLMVPKAWI